ncbi:MAG: SUMF1/EgtB/PvdO family nonheme iron enzyme, partial [Candidatus Hydrogenedentes bacterium]|nr:SUMF1/EgtB/PvdO family nonheme iron enzyme [Candidatus Hydrogenedentota bacterium]
GQQPGEQDAYPNKETPQHAVRISKGFWMGRFEVTQAQWEAVMGTKPWAGRKYAHEDKESPAIYVSWEDAEAFVRQLAANTGKPVRLPTEAEWEYACRAETATRFYWGNDPDYEDIDHFAWWRGNVLVTPELHARPVGLLPPNPFDLHDMSGNVSEWCQDWHGYYFDGLCINPTGPGFAEHRVVRGGSWLTVGGHCRSSRRHHEPPDAAHSDIGFRVVVGETPVKAAGEPEFTNVFVAGEEGVNTYRIPALLLTPDGSLLAFCEARKESQADASPTDMVLRRSRDGGRTWLPNQVLVQGEGAEALMNPCPVVDHVNGAIVLLCTSANKVRPDHHQHFQLTSADSGQTWTKPIDLGARIVEYDDTFNPGPGVGIQLKNGRLVAPGYTGEIDEETDENWHARVLYSDDHGATWTLGAPVPHLSDESQAVELRDGTLMLNARGNMGKSRRGVALSKDGGQTWSSMYSDKALNECPCQASILRCRLPDGGTGLLFANPDNHGEKFGVVERTKMTVRLSYDEGKTWPVKRLIHAGPSSYSTMVQFPDGDIGLLFEGGEKHRREWIRFARFTLSWLANG